MKHNNTHSKEYLPVWKESLSRQCDPDTDWSRPQTQPRVAIYVRVSTEEQKEKGYSLAQQIDFLKDYCMERKWKYVKIYSENGVSGATLNRPKFELMMFHASQGIFDTILVYKIDRISRSNIDLQRLVEYLKLLNIKLVSATEPMDMTSLSGKLVFDFLAGVAEWERGVIKERTRLGALGRAKKGLWHGGTTPFGYKYNSETGMLEICPDEAEVVQKIFNKFIELSDMRKLWKWLREEKLLARNKKPLSRATVLKILSNPIYIGIQRFTQITHKYEQLRIIDNETFDTAQEIKNKIVTPRRRRCPNASQSPQDPRFCINCGEELFGAGAYCSNCGAPQWLGEYGFIETRLVNSPKVFTTSPTSIGTE